MRIQSPLSNLCETIEQAKEAASRYEPVLRKNEAATRAVLIDPILRALGWDTANTSMVEVEKKDGDSIADYALYDTNGDVVVIVEAKAAGTKLTDQVALTLVHYAFQFGAKRLFLTDGLSWRYYCDFAPGSVKPERTIDLAHDGIVDAAAYLVQRLDAAIFWPERPTVDELSQKVSQLESEIASLRSNLDKVKESLNQVPPKPPDLHFLELAKIQDVKGRKPRALRLPDGSIIQVAKWSEVLRECCKWALNAHPALPLPLLDDAGRTVELLGFKQPPTGINYVVQQHQGQTIYVRTTYDANHSVANAQHILDQVPAALKAAAAAVAIEKG